MRRVLAFGALACALTGCGTVNNFHGSWQNSRPYGGVDLALDDIEQSKQGTVVLPWLVWPMIVSNVPLSAVGDTVTLPVTLTAEAVRAINAYYFPPEPQPNLWREFWYNEQPLPPRVEGGIW